MTTRRVAIYARVSSAEQARPDATSIKKQFDAGLLEAQRIRSFGDDVEIVKQYADEGVSGAKAFEDRPEGFQLLLDAKRGKFDTVIFFSLDRFTRNAAKGLADFERMEDDLGLTLIFAKENIDTRQASGKLFRTILAAFAEFERDTIRDRNMAGRYGKAKKGKGWATGMPPFGFRVAEDGDLEEEPDEANIIRQMFTMRANGSSMPTIARELNRQGLKPRERTDSKTGEPIPSSFSAGSINGYLKNDAYKGAPIVRHIRPSHNQPPEEFLFPVPEIVPPKVWDKANAHSPSHVPNAGSKQNPYGLSQRIWHVHTDDSNASMYGTTRKTPKGKVRFYRCSASRERPGQAPSCTGLGEAYGQEMTSVQADWIESQSLLWMLDMLSHPEAAEKVLRDIEDDSMGEIEYERLKSRQNDLEARRERWVEQYADGVIDRAKRDEHISAIEDELEDIEREIGRYQAQEAHFASVNHTLDQLLTMKVEEGGSDPQMSEAPEIGSAQWWEEVRVHARRSSTPGKYGRSEPLPFWLLEDIEDIATRLDIKVYLTRNDAEPREPKYYIGFAPPPFAHITNGETARQETYTLTEHRESQDTQDGSYPPSTIVSGRFSEVALPVGTSVRYFEGSLASTADQPPPTEWLEPVEIVSDETLRNTGHYDDVLDEDIEGEEE